MATYNAMFVFVVALLVFSITNPSAHSQLDIPIPGLPGMGVPIGLLNINGQICCTNTGNCPGTGISGLALNVSCYSCILGTNITIGQGVTNGSGYLNLTTLFPFPLLSLSPGMPNITPGTVIPNCTVQARLPLQSAVCKTLSTASGILQSAIKVVNVITNGTIAFLNATTVTFSVNA